MSPALGLNDDFLDLLRALVEAEVEFMVVGRYAMAVHGVPRATGNLDVVVRSSAANAARMLAALRSFGAPLDARSVGESLRPPTNKHLQRTESVSLVSRSA